MHPALDWYADEKSLDITGGGVFFLNFNGANAFGDLEPYGCGFICSKFYPGLKLDRIFHD